jgi:hypothetical protein
MALVRAGSARDQLTYRKRLMVAISSLRGCRRLAWRRASFFAACMDCRNAGLAHCDVQSCIALCL